MILRDYDRIEIPSNNRSPDSKECFIKPSKIRQWQSTHGGFKITQQT